jgi:hypothetical protein
MSDPHPRNATLCRGLQCICTTGNSVVLVRRKPRMQQTWHQHLNGTNYWTSSTNLTRMLFNDAVNCDDSVASVIYEWVWDITGMILTRLNRNIKEKNHPSATLPTITPARTDLGLKVGVRGDRSAVKRPSHGRPLLKKKVFWNVTRCSLVNFFRVSKQPPSIILTNETSSFGTLANVYKITWRHIPEDSHRRGNLKSNTVFRNPTWIPAEMEQNPLKACIHPAGRSCTIYAHSSAAWFMYVTAAISDGLLTYVQQRYHSRDTHNQTNDRCVTHGGSCTRQNNPLR